MKIVLLSFALAFLASASALLSRVQCKPEDDDRYRIHWTIDNAKRPHRNENDSDRTARFGKLRRGL